MAALLSWFLLGVGIVAQSVSPQAIFDRAVAHFTAGRVAESAAEFDNLVRVAPVYGPSLWERGIALYYAGRFNECRAQFESHRTVNPADVENAAWHFMCVARADSPEKAKAALLPVGPDARVPMREIYEMFRGTLGAAEVLSAGAASVRARFYSHLYVGLYSEAMGNSPRALEHIGAAASEEYAQAGGYMHIVARVHLAALERKR
jgi:lipoprotein NlpI